MISLANISNSLEIEFEANPTLDLVAFLSLKTRSTKLGLVIFAEKLGYGVVLYYGLF